MARRIADNIFLLTTIAGALIAWLIAFIGACIFRRGISGGAWWIVVYELLLIMAISATLLTNTYTHYRMMILTFLAASIAMLTLQLDYALPTTKFTPGYRNGAGAYAAGYIILIIIEFLWVIVFGSEPESYIGSFAPAHYGNAVGVAQQSARQPSSHESQQYEMSGDKEILAESAGAPYNSYSSTNNHVVVPTSPQAVTTPVTGADLSTEYKEKVKALHAYQANPEDPNELSFGKGEILDIVDRNGNWWQARKADGTVGIIPSNYFGSSA
ncbi:hypothetical protein [Parasitella parasitica]|uniref:SH3 domain-containing protein n=1 Tax=Parasitella parasitica TaxID=35722 RepID=A0A0B7NF59_9FUNG|nr:hypothetical protein [Parasitella parasitica]